MFKIGSHLSAAKGYENMGKDALKIGANTFQFFTRNPRGGKAKAIDKADIDAFLALAEENRFAQFVAHAPYTLNCCSIDPKIRNFAYMAVTEDLERMEYLPGNYYNFHPGSHVGQGVEKGIGLIAELLNDIIKPEQHTMVLLETMAGKGSEVGSRFEELSAIIEKVKIDSKMGVCLDLCHVHDAGYDIAGDLDGVLSEFDRIIGLDRLKAIHVNDSLNLLGAHKDRHAKVGEGHLGLDGIVHVINHPKLRELPFILETPTDLEGHGQEIADLKERYNE